MSLQELLRARVADGANQPAYVFLGHDLEVTHELTYAALGQAAETIAEKLRMLTQPSDRVLLASINAPDAVQLFWGCVLANTIPIPAPAPDTRNAKVSAARLQGIAVDASVALALTHENLVETGCTQIPEVAWQSLQSLLVADSQSIDPRPVRSELAAPINIAYLQYTSGSTSAPRGVEITHGNVLAQCTALMGGLDTIGKRGLIWLPWFHDYGLVHGVIQPIFSSGTAFLMSTAHFLLRPLSWLEAIERHRITHSGAPNFAYLACVQALARKPNWTARLDSWQLATCGAEPVRAATLAAFDQAFTPFGLNKLALTPSYGLAEAVLAVTVRPIHKPLIQVTLDARAMDRNHVQASPAHASGTRTLLGCGPALPGFELRIVDPESAKTCAPDRIGEIWLAGPSVGQGYWGQPAATTEHFGATLADQGADSTPYLRTGDLGFIHEGELFVAGRRKDMIVVGGRNLYPQDLEQTAETAHPTIRAGSVFAVSIDKGVRETVVLLVECSRIPSPQEARELIDSVQKQVGHEHQVELDDIVPLRAGALPRTSSGKPMRSAARRLYQQGALEPLRLKAEARSQRALPQPDEPDSSLVESLTQLWSDVLGHDTIEPNANFFDLGGDSLLATQLVSRLRARMGVELPISALFERPTVHGLAGLVVQAQEQAPHAGGAAVEEPSPPSIPREPGARVALSFSQERMWFMHELAPESSAYNVPLAIRLQGALNVGALQTALARVIDRHEILRTRFVQTSEGIFGEVVAPVARPIEEVHLAVDGPATSDNALHRHLAEMSCIPFRLDHGPLLRAQVIHTGEQAAVLLIVMHHIISDQWSFAELGQELATQYSAIQTGEKASLPNLPIQYADYSQWQRRWFEGTRRANELAYWRRRLAGLEPMPLNADFPQARTQNFRGAAVRLPLDPDHIVALRRLGAAQGASLSMVLIAALNVMLHRHTGKADIALGVPIANRHHLASENLIGTFVNTLVFRTDLAGDPDFRTVLSRVRQVSLEAFAHQDMPFELLVRELAAQPGASRQPPFNVMFNMVNSQARDCHFEGLTWSRVVFDRASTQFDLTVVADLLYDHALVIEYATDLFSPETVQRMGDHLERILRAAVSTPEAPVATIPLLGDAERATLKKWSLGPTTQPEASSVVDWVANGWRTSAHQTALVFGSVHLTHQDVEAASNRLARLLRQRGIERGTRVGVCLPRGNELVIALLAILKTGAAYVPLDPGYPSQRLSQQIDDAELALLITQRSVALVCEQTPRLLLDAEHTLITNMAAEPLEPDQGRDPRPDDPAYVIYTSGSTGQPKGVVVPHRAVVNLLASMARSPGLQAQDRLLAVTTPSFDISVLELFLPLGVGGTVVIASEAQAADGRLLAEAMAREKITVMQATPSRWHMLLDAGWNGDPGLKALVGGEPLAPSLATTLLARCAEVWNMYGPTETTVWSSCWQVSPEHVRAIDLGRPVMNTSIQVLDEHHQPCPIGVPGEIYIGGTGLALGYHQRKALTAERFLVPPATLDGENARLYRTGDRGRWRHDGSLEHGGRLDDQIKLRGFRVELGEIEAHLLSHAGVARAVVMLREDLPGQTRLVAYVVPDGAMPSSDGLRDHLHRGLPDHMVPSRFVEVASIPVLPNGKTNRAALPPPIEGSTHSGAAPEMPRNATEKTIHAIWQATLQTDRFGIHDNFFDLGGHSIQAVGVVSRIETTLQRPCALALLFKHPTVATLSAALMLTPADGTADVPVAVLQPHGRAPGLFLLAGAEMYRQLAQQLDPGMPVYGVFSQTEIDLLQRPADAPLVSVSVETLSQEYLALIRSIQPHGPYYLGGFSIGGVLAFEVAQRLRATGEEIGLIILLDSMLPGHGFKHLRAGFLRRLRLIHRQGLKHFLHVFQVYRSQTAQRHEPGIRRNQTYAQAMRNHEPTPCNLPSLFLQASEDASTAPAYGWKAFLPNLTVERTPGKHMDILEPPNVDLLASTMRKHIAMANPPASCGQLEGGIESPHNVSGSSTCR